MAGACSPPWVSETHAWCRRGLLLGGGVQADDGFMQLMELPADNSMERTLAVAEACPPPPFLPLRPLTRALFPSTRHQDHPHMFPSITQVRGIKTNIPFLENVFRHPEFVGGQPTTSFIEKNAAELFRWVQPPPRPRARR